MIKVLHIITGLFHGGAERTLVNIATRLQGRIRSEVIVLTGVGPRGKQLRDAGVDFISLGMSGGPLALLELARLARLIADRRPDIVQTWMYHSDLLGGIAARMANVGAIVWNIRNGSLSWSLNKATTLLAASLCARLSHFVPQRIVCCSERSRDIHARRGYAREKLILIPNGIDIAEFYPDKAAGAALRERWGLAPQDILIGRIGRLDPMKDYPTFLNAAAEFKKRFPNARFLCMGVEQETKKRDLQALALRLDLNRNLIFSGEGQEMRDVYNALTLLTSSSSGGEAFPNVVAEAMACCVPCVVTDVGDSALIVQDTGRVVRPRDPERMAQACCSLIEIGEAERRRLGRLGRARIEECFSIARAVDRYEALYEEVI
ncbi:MAG: glycosyltransferase [Candidatus Acidiferrales bacterium]